MRFRAIFISLVCIAILSINVNAQHTQKLKGIIIDRDSRLPLPGANISVIDLNPAIGTASDSNGEFVLNNIPFGRHNIQVTFLGYEDYTIKSHLVSSGKEPYLTIELKEKIISTKEVEIRALRNADAAINPMTTVSAKTFTVEETKRYAGGFNDLSRMTESFAGVASFTGETNEIVIRGNSPRSLLWRIEGIEIANPNHFPRGNGSSGGGISIITADIITNSDFLTGAFPAEYGNALSGVFDINLRNGNKDKHEIAIQTGVIGIEATAEGPIFILNGSSYLVNYRYSTLKLFDLAGIKLVDNSVIPEFQDLAFKLNFPTKKAGTFSLFGLGGLSSAGERAMRDSSEWLMPNDRLDEYELHRMGAAGLKHFLPLKNKKSYLKVVILADCETNEFRQDSLTNNYSTFNLFKEAYLFPSLRSSISYNHKFNQYFSLRAGIFNSILRYSLDSKHYSYVAQSQSVLSDERGDTYLSSGFVQIKYRARNGLGVNAGLHSQYFSLNNEIVPEPRLGLQYEFGGTHLITFAFGKHSRIEPISIYFTKNNLGTEYPNKSLRITKSIHNVLGYSTFITENIKTKIEIYHQYLYDVPVEADSSSVFSAINYRGGNASTVLNNSGTGYNFGSEITVEKFFSAGYYFLFTSSIYNSKYRAPDGKLYNTFYNGNYIFNFVAGKEFVFGENNNIFGINGKAIWKGGNRYIPIDLDASIMQGSEVMDYSSVYQKQTPDFIRFDLSIFIKRNHPHFAWTLSVDFQNITNRKNVFSYTYNPESETIRPINSLPFIPVINYRIEL